MWAQDIEINMEGEELCLIDSGIDSLRKVPLRPGLQVLNLHCNNISRIENLTILQNLKHLDLSSNQIRFMQGLDALVSLRTLNLSCNQIATVDGLKNLKQLVKLSLSYNQIVDLSGFGSVQGPEYKLSQVELQGNQIESLQSICVYLRGCSNLRHLSLSQGGANNPVCQDKVYRETVIGSLPMLHLLDGHDRDGQPVLQDDILADIPGLDQYMEFLLSNESSDANPIALATPHIDMMLSAYRDKGVTTPEVTTTSELDSSHHEGPEANSSTPLRRQSGDSSSNKTPIRSPNSTPKKSGKKQSSDHEIRLETLEKQLAQLLTGKKGMKPGKTAPGSVSPRVQRYSAKRDVDDTDESETDSSNKRMGIRGKPTKSRIPGRTVASNAPKKQPSRQTKQKGKSSSNCDAEPLLVRGRSPERMGKGSTVVFPSNQPTAIAKDEELRDDIKSTYVSLMAELETERERRWKAEQAMRKLAEHIKQIQSRAKEDNNLNEVAIDTTNKLKYALTNERESRLKTQAEKELLQEELQELNSKFDQVLQGEKEARSAIRTMEETATKTEREHLQQQAHQGKQLQEAQMRAAATTREAELLKSNVRTLKGQVQQLQELLANREQEHRAEMTGRYSLDSTELQDVLKREISKTERLHSKELQSQQQKIDLLTKQYAELEDEFRMALHIECARFQELKNAYERVSQENARRKETFTNTQKKEEKSSEMVSELTALVKEQKGRITELVKSKGEQFSEFKERVQTLEAHLEEARRRMVQLEMLKKEKVKLTSQIQAQDSVIEGLKAERRLWGEELAQQGSSLAQDRGRLEAKIETQASELNNLKRQLDREADATRIKTKMVEDQTETIRKLKEGVLERDAEIKKARDDLIKVQRECEEQLMAETTANTDLQEKYDRLKERKEELKGQVEELEDQLEESKQAHSILNKRWKEKSNMIGNLEQEVTRMKSTWENKEKQVSEERDKALNAASLAIEKLKSMDDSFRKQLDAKEQSHHSAMESLIREKQEEIDLANKRVLEVENEMRQLLLETEASKRATEDRVKRLTQAFSDLQQNLL